MQGGKNEKVIRSARRGRAPGRRGRLALALDDDTTHDLTITVDEVAMIRDIGADPSFTIEAPGTAGDELVVTPTNDDTKWLQYTSVVADAGETRKITAIIDDVAGDTPPAGTTLSVTASDPTTGGDECGTLGSNNGKQDLSWTASVDVVTGVGSGWTGTGAAEGVNLLYEYVIDDCQAGQLFESSYLLKIKYTLTDSSP